jgi:hypothetical protein
MWTRTKKINKQGEVKYANTKLLTPFIVTNIEGDSMDTSSWSFDIGFHFREAIGLRYCTKVKTITTDGVKKKKRWNTWQQTPILSFHEGDTLYHRDKKSLIQLEHGLPSGFEQEDIDHGTVRICRYVFDTETKSWHKQDRFAGNQLDLLLIAILGYDYLNRMTPLLLEKTSSFQSDKILNSSSATHSEDNTTKENILISDSKIENLEFDF